MTLHFQGTLTFALGELYICGVSYQKNKTENMPLHLFFSYYTYSFLDSVPNNVFTPFIYDLFPAPTTSPIPSLSLSPPSSNPPPLHSPFPLPLSCISTPALIFLIMICFSFLRVIFSYLAPISFCPSVYLFWLPFCSLALFLIFLIFFQVSGIFFTHR